MQPLILDDGKEVESTTKDEDYYLRFITFEEKKVKSSSEKLNDILPG